MTPEEFEELTPDQRDLFITALARVEQQGKETAYMSQFMQGATLNYADELYAKVKSDITGRPYEEIKREELDRLNQFQQTHPTGALASELLGSFVPAIAGERAFRPRTLKGVAGLGAVEGSAAALGASEGSAADLLGQTLGGGVMGGTLTAAADVGLRNLGKLGNFVLDKLRRMGGDRLGTVAENEIRRLAAGTNQTPDEIVARIAAGEILSDNQTLHMSVRALMSRGGIPETLIREQLPERAESLRLQSKAALQEGLTNQPADANVLRATRLKEADFKAQMRNAYKSVFQAGDLVPDEMLPTLLSGVNRLPSARAAIEEAYKSAGRKSPIEFEEDRALEFVTNPTLEDAEIIRRVLNDTATDSYKTGKGYVGEQLSDFEGTLREQLDDFSPRLKETRARYSLMMDAREAFEKGRRSLNDPEQLQIDFDNLTNPETIQAFREGVMAQLNKAYANVGGKQIAKHLMNPEHKLGKMFNYVFPVELQSDVIRQMTTAARAQQTYENVIGNSVTQLAQEANQGLGKQIGIDEIAGAARLNPMDIISIGSKLVGQMKPDLSESQRTEIVNVLLSEDPQVVMRALTDESALAALLQKVNQIGSTLTRQTAIAAGATGGGTFADQYQEFRGLK